jgi:hypothetical protein
MFGDCEYKSIVERTAHQDSATANASAALFTAAMSGESRQEEESPAPPSGGGKPWRAGYGSVSPAFFNTREQPEPRRADIDRNNWKNWKEQTQALAAPEPRQVDPRWIPPGFPSPATPDDHSVSNGPRGTAEPADSHLRTSSGSGLVDVPAPKFESARVERSSNGADNPPKPAVPVPQFSPDSSDNSGKLKKPNDFFPGYPGGPASKPGASGESGAAAESHAPAQARTGEPGLSHPDLTAKRDAALQSGY